jgi:hypothetical protein
LRLAVLRLVEFARAFSSRPTIESVSSRSASAATRTPREWRRMLG